MSTSLALVTPKQSDTLLVKLLLEGSFALSLSATPTAILAASEPATTDTVAALPLLLQSQLALNATPLPESSLSDALTVELPMELVTMDIALLDTAAFNLPTCAVPTLLVSKFTLALVDVSLPVPAIAEDVDLDILASNKPISVVLLKPSVLMEPKLPEPVSMGNVELDSPVPTDSAVLLALLLLVVSMEVLL